MPSGYKCTGCKEVFHTKDECPRWDSNGDTVEYGEKYDHGEHMCHDCAETVFNILA